MQRPSTASSPRKYFAASTQQRSSRKQNHASYLATFHIDKGLILLIATDSTNFSDVWLYLAADFFCNQQKVMLNRQAKA